MLNSDMVEDPRTYVYVDGFNLYYGAVRGTPHKWLNLRQMCQLLLPRHRLLSIKYFTAIVSARNDPEKPLRQQMYLRALRTLPGCSVILGQFLTTTAMMPLASATPKGSQFVRVLKTEEKGSDVNLATHLLHDAHLNRYDVAVLVSNDSDLVEPLRLVRSELGKRVCVVNPHKQHPSKALLRESDMFRQLRSGLLARCRLPDELRDDRGAFRCPEKWRRS